MAKARPYANMPLHSSGSYQPIARTSVMSSYGTGTGTALTRGSLITVSVYVKLLFSVSYVCRLPWLLISLWKMHYVYNGVAVPMRAPFRTRTTLPSSINGMTEWSSSSILTWVLQRSAAELLTLMLVAAAATLSTHPLFSRFARFCSSATSL